MKMVFLPGWTKLIHLIKMRNRSKNESQKEKKSTSNVCQYRKAKNKYVSLWAMYEFRLRSDYVKNQHYLNNTSIIINKFRFNGIFTN